MPKRAAAKSKKQTKPTEKSAPAPAPTPPSEPRSRAAEDRLALRVAVLEDVVKRAHNELARRISDVEKRLAPS
jgi:hypothetical protein